MRSRCLRSWLARFGQTDAAERVVAALRYLAPATAGAGSMRTPDHPQKMQAPLKLPHEL